MKKLERGEYGYLKYRKKSLILQLILVVLIAVGIFILGLALNKWQASNIFTVVSIVMVLPAAKILVVLIVVFPFKQITEKEKEHISALVRDTDKVYFDSVFTSSERHMHLDCIIVCEHQVIGYTSRQKDNIDKINEYFKKEFSARGIDFVCFATNSEKAFENRLKLRSSSETLTAKQAEDIETVNEFIRVAIV